MIGTAWRRMWGIHRWEGWGGVLRQAVRKVTRPVIEVRRWHFFEADLQVPVTLPTPPVPLEVRPATPADLEAHGAVLRALGVDLEECRRRLDRGDVAIIALAGGGLAHIQWISYTSPVVIREIGVRLHLDPAEGYLYSGLTVPEWRGKGISSVPTAFTTSYSLARGVTRHLYYVRADNAPALKAPTRLGRRRTKTVWAVRLLGRPGRRLLGVTREGSPSLERA